MPVRSYTIAALLLCADVLGRSAANAQASEAMFTYLPKPQAMALREARDDAKRLSTYDKAYLSWLALTLSQPECGLTDSGGRRRIQSVVEGALMAANFEDPFSQMRAQGSIDYALGARACKSQDGADLLTTIVETLEEQNRR